jgi:integral membrane protein
LSADTEIGTIKQLNLIRIIAIADLILLLPLLANLVGIVDSEAMVSVIGPIHGIGFLVLLFLCVRGAGEERWGWWFPGIVLITLGPIGSLYGEHRVRGRIEAEIAADAASPGSAPA